jgi:hypothetical protein
LQNISYSSGEQVSFQVFGKQKSMTHGSFITG